MTSRLPWIPEPESLRKAVPPMSRPAWRAWVVGYIVFWVLMASLTVRLGYVFVTRLGAGAVDAGLVVLLLTLGTFSLLATVGIPIFLVRFWSQRPV